MDIHRRGTEVAEKKIHSVFSVTSVVKLVLIIKGFLNLKYLFLIFLSLTLFACANVPPYKREILSKPVMQFDSEKTDRLAREHFLNSLEGSSGGFGVGGGGCGCN